MSDNSKLSNADFAKKCVEDKANGAVKGFQKGMNDMTESGNPIAPFKEAGKGIVKECAKNVPEAVDRIKKAFN